MNDFSIRNNKAPEDLNQKVSDLMHDKGLIDLYLTSSLVNLFTSENKCQYILLRDPNSTRMNDFMMDRIIPVTIYILI